MIVLYTAFPIIMAFGSSMPILVSPATTAVEPLRITHAIASGDVTATEAVIWARANCAAQMVVEYTPVPAVSWPLLRQVGPLVEARDDFAGKIVLAGLTPDTRYLYCVHFIASAGLLRVEVRDADGLVPFDLQGRPGALTLTPAH